MKYKWLHYRSAILLICKLNIITQYHKYYNVFRGNICDNLQECHRCVKQAATLFHISTFYMTKYNADFKTDANQISEKKLWN
jgi:hypothetical protein